MESPGNAPYDYRSRSLNRSASKWSNWALLRYAGEGALR